MFEDYEDLDFQKIGVKIPDPNVPVEEFNRFGIEIGNNLEYLKALCREGFQEKCKKFPHLKNNKTYINRIKKELDVYEKTLFVDYLLLNYFIVKWCNENKIVVNPRGSAASSIVLWLLGISRIDPIKHNLIFERFLSADRIEVLEGGRIDPDSVGDIDLDLPPEGRKKLISYLESIFENRFCKIGTFGTLSSPILMKECCKLFLEWDDKRAEVISKNIPKPHGRALSLGSAMESVEPLKKLFESNKEIKEIAFLLEGLYYRFGSHASAYLTMAEDIDNCLPVQLEKNAHGEFELLTSWDMEEAMQEHIKCDLLSVKGISLIRDVCEDVGIDPETIDYEDSFIYSILQNLNQPFGLFQISADSNYGVLKKVRPKDIDELTDVLSLCRPGALAYVGDYVNYKDSETESNNKF